MHNDVPHCSSFDMFRRTCYKKRDTCLPTSAACSTGGRGGGEAEREPGPRKNCKRTLIKPATARWRNECCGKIKCGEKKKNNAKTTPTVCAGNFLQIAVDRQNTIQRGVLISIGSSFSSRLSRHCETVFNVNVRKPVESCEGKKKKNTLQNSSSIGGRRSSF